MFQVEQDVFCPLYGIIRVGEVEEKDVAGAIEKFYVFYVKSSKIMIPIERASNLGFREIKTKKELEDFINSLKGSNLLTGSNKWSERYASYLELIKKGDPFFLNDVIKDLYWQNKDNIFSSKEKDVWNRLYRNLVEEVAYIQKLTKNQANKFVSKILWETK